MIIKRRNFYIFFLCFWASASFTKPGPDDILGKWISTRKNLKVQVYKDGKEFKGFVIWFKDSDNPQKPIATRTDENNPDPNLRQRKVLGMQVLSRLTYNTKSSRWENGKIYDAKSGKTWSSVAYLDEYGILNVRGYWQFEIIGRTMRFKKAE